MSTIRLSYRRKNKFFSYHDFFGIMTFYQECCIYAISSKKGRDNVGDFSSIYKFF